MRLTLQHLVPSILILLIFVMIAIHYWRPTNKYEKRENFNNSNNVNNKLLPIFDPMYNMREWCKQSVLLEDHLTHPRKRCNDCITKHCLTLEALAEEACTLDKQNHYKDLLLTIPDFCRSIHKRVLNNDDKHSIAQELRLIRKKLMPHCRDHF